MIYYHILKLTIKTRFYNYILLAVKISYHVRYSHIGVCFGYFFFDRYNTLRGFSFDFEGIIKLNDMIIVLNLLTRQIFNMHFEKNFTTNIQIEYINIL